MISWRSSTLRNTIFLSFYIILFYFGKERKCLTPLFFIYEKKLIWLNKTKRASYTFLYYPFSTFPPASTHKSPPYFSFLWRKHNKWEFSLCFSYHNTKAITISHLFFFPIKRQLGTLVSLLLNQKTCSLSLEFSSPKSWFGQHSRIIWILPH